jgi:hypothetical protein
MFSGDVSGDQAMYTLLYTLSCRFNSGNNYRFPGTPSNFAQLPRQNCACTPRERPPSRRVGLKGGLRLGRQPTP